MGDIALPDGDSGPPVVAHTPVDDEEQERQEVEELLADAPDTSGDPASVSARSPGPVKFNATFQLDLEKLKQEVYHEGLQVEEEGLTDIIRKKTKLPSSVPVNLTAGQGQLQSQVSEGKQIKGKSSTETPPIPPECQ